MQSIWNVLKSNDHGGMHWHGKKLPLNKDYDLYAASTSGLGFHPSRQPFMCVSWCLVVGMSLKVLMFFPFQGVLYAYYLDMCDCV
jgi:uncharacterized membrane protein